MSTVFFFITEEFGSDLDAIRSLVNAFDEPQTGNPKTRIAAINSSTLLLAATFEEFVRQMARACAKAVVASIESFEYLPSRLASTAWLRTLKTLARVQIDNRANFLEARARFNAVSEFCGGDLEQDIYEELIHNENNMRPGEINSLFKVSGLNDICSKIVGKQHLLANFDETEPGKAHGRLLESLEEFFERRNRIAHSLDPAQSRGPDQVLKDIKLFSAFGKALCETLEDFTTDASAAAPRRAAGTPR